ncbi:MAG: hypothetical protein ACKVQS_10460 [Fimbriimonadaceae bacterium]
MITVTQTYAGNYIIPPAITDRRSQGIPPGGPADPFLSTLALHLANSDTCLEITSPITLTTTEPTQIALAAPPNSQPLPNHPTTTLALIPLLPGEPLTIQSPKTGYRLYLSWPGLQSPSRLPEQLTSNILLPATPTSSPQLLAFNACLTIPRENTIFYLPVIDFTDEAQPDLDNPPPDFTLLPCLVTPHISRIGTRIIPQANPLTEDRGEPAPDLIRGTKGRVEEIIFQLSNTTLTRSEPSIHGAIQVTPDRQLLIHGPDGPTLGGYPKLGAITQASLPLLTQLRPGQQVILTPCTIVQASRAHKDAQEHLEQTIAKIDRALQIAGHST